MKTNLIVGILILIAVIGGGAYLYMHPMAPAAPTNEPVATTTGQTATTTVEGPTQVIGASAGGNDITAYHYGSGSDEILFVAGIHGGYGWNNVLLARNLMTYLGEHPDAIAANEKVTVIPVLNPDGLEEVVGTTGEFTAADVPDSQAETIPGRFNANNVDLNRNFDCDWQATGTWQSRSVSGGTAAFSEPETKALKAYIEAHNPVAVVAYYSAGGGVYASNCHSGVLPETETILNEYADASGYKAYEDFDFYEITGDMVNWLAKEKIPAISIVLTDHSNTEWDKNWKGIEALLEHYAD